ncbi:MAG: beta-Ala-His dipeptidase [Candidatus Lokiarchaeota archaeon]|nr:beta-Ala-His dipeptidase [Candidatus Lokiarchaeota archaeon]
MLELNNIGTPKEFWHYFFEICKIPRCSGNEESIRNFIENNALNFNFIFKRDKIGNLVVIVPASQSEKKPIKIAFQCHMDMVCEKDFNKKHDFSKDPIDIEIIKIDEKYWIKAKGTTLGADNGVGIAYCLALMDMIFNKKLIIHKISLEFLFTVQEEKGLSGAFNISDDFINSDYLINLDSEEDDKITIGSAGGINTIGSINLNIKEKIRDDIKLKPIKLSITNLNGGHSGIDINKGRGNALKIISKILWKINNRYGIYLNSILGGNLPNAIPREAESIFYVEEEKSNEIFLFIDQIISEIELGIKNIEKDMKIRYEELKNYNIENIYPKTTSDKLLNVLYVIPNGPISIHPKKHDLVYTSTNLASIKIKGQYLKIITSQRSLHHVSKKIISEKIQALFNLADINIDLIGEYPGWIPNFESKLLKIVEKSYKELYKRDPIIQTIHAGLETGILSNIFPNIDIISLGPLILEGHSPNERLQINSVEKIWNLIITILNNFN